MKRTTAWQKIKGSKVEATAKAVAYLIDHPDASAYRVAAETGVTPYIANKLIRDRQTPLKNLLRDAPQPEATPGAKLLREAVEVFEQRGKEYGSASGTVHTIAAVWSTISGYPITPHTAALMLVGLKISRLMQSPGHKDSIVDIAGYAAVLADVVSDGQS